MDWVCHVADFPPLSKFCPCTRMNKQSLFNFLQLCDSSIGKSISEQHNRSYIIVTVLSNSAFNANYLFNWHILIRAWNNPPDKLVEPPLSMKSNCSIAFFCEVNLNKYNWRFSYLLLLCHDRGGQQCRHSGVVQDKSKSVFVLQLLDHKFQCLKEGISGKIGVVISEDISNKSISKSQIERSIESPLSRASISALSYWSFYRPLRWCPPEHDFLLQSPRRMEHVVRPSPAIRRSVDKAQHWQVIRFEMKEILTRIAVKQKVSNQWTGASLRPCPPLSYLFPWDPWCTNGINFYDLRKRFRSAEPKSKISQRKKNYYWPVSVGMSSNRNDFFQVTEVCEFRRFGSSQGFPWKLFTESSTDLRSNLRSNLRLNSWRKWLLEKSRKALGYWSCWVCVSFLSCTRSCSLRDTKMNMYIDWWHLSFLNKTCLNAGPSDSWNDKWERLCHRLSSSQLLLSFFLPFSELCCLSRESIKNTLLCGGCREYPTGYSER